MTTCFLRNSRQIYEHKKSKIFRLSFITWILIPCSFIHPQIGLNFTVHSKFLNLLESVMRKISRASISSLMFLFTFLLYHKFTLSLPTPLWNSGCFPPIHLLPMGCSPCIVSSLSFKLHTSFGGLATDYTTLNPSLKQPSPDLYKTSFPADFSNWSLSNTAILIIRGNFNIHINNFSKTSQLLGFLTSSNGLH